jgi:hypothetical protein
MPRDLDLTFDISTGALTLDRVVGNYVKRSETLTLSVTIVSNGASATIPAGLVGTLKPVNTYGTTLAQWTTFSQVGATNVYTASTTINAAAVTTLLGTTTEQAYCVFDFAGAGVVESDTLALVLKNNVTRDDDTAPTALLNRNDFLVTNGTGLLVNVAAGYAANGAFVAAQSSLAITNATNYIEVTAAGVASVNTTAFTAGSYPLATVVASAGAITANTDLRAWITPKPGASGGVTSITGTANEITVTGTTTPTLSLPSALTFTGKTVTGGTFNSGAFNGTVGATTPSTVAGTTITGTGSLTLGTNGGTGGSIVLNGSTSGSSTLSVAATGVLALPSFTVGSITVGNGIVSADRITAQNPVTATLGIDISPYNGAEQVTAGHPWMRLGGGSSDSLMINAGLTGGYVYICADLGSGLIVRDGTGGHETFLTTPATGTLRVTTNGSTLGTVEAATGTFTTLTASATTSLLLGTAGSAVGNVGFRNATSGTTTLAPATGALGTGTVTLPLSGTLATLAGAETFTGAKTFSTNPVTLSGNQSRAAWTTTGTGLVQAAASYTDTSSSGTVAVTAINNLAQPTLLASSATTYTDSFVTRMAGPPVASTNVTQTRAHTLGILDSTISNASTDGALVVAAAFGTSATSVGIGGGNISAGGTVLAAHFSTTGGIIIGNAANIRSSGSNSTMSIQGSSTQFGTGNVTVLTIGGPSSTNSKSSGQTNVCAITPLYTGQTGTASNTDLLINRTETAIGSGAQLLIDAQVATVSRFSVTNAGNVTAAGTLAVTGATTLTGLLTANGGVTLGDAQNIAFNTTTGTKIGTATTQKLSFWNSTPIVQPTTAVASASVAHAGGGTNIKTDDTFDGYTIAQVVKALRNAGLLA